MSFLGTGVGNHQIKQLETRIQDLEREKEFLQGKISTLEKNNKDLHAYQKSLEDAIQQIGQEQDESKKLSMIQTNLLRRKSIMRLEKMQFGSSSKQESSDRSLSASPELAKRGLNQRNQVPTFSGQKASQEHFLPGATGLLAPSAPLHTIPSGRSSYDQSRESSPMRSYTDETPPLALSSRQRSEHSLNVSASNIAQSQAASIFGITESSNPLAQFGSREESKGVVQFAPPYADDDDSEEEAPVQKGGGFLGMMLNKQNNGVSKPIAKQSKQNSMPPSPPPPQSSLKPPTIIATPPREKEEQKTPVSLPPPPPPPPSQNHLSTATLLLPPPPLPPPPLISISKPDAPITPKDTEKEEEKIAPLLPQNPPPAPPSHIAASMLPPPPHPIQPIQKAQPIEQPPPPRVPSQSSLQPPPLPMPSISSPQPKALPIAPAQPNKPVVYNMQEERIPGAYIPPAPHVYYGWPEPVLPPGVVLQQAPILQQVPVQQQQIVEEVKQVQVEVKTVQVEVRQSQPELRLEGTGNAYIPPAPHVYYGWPEPPLPPGVVLQAVPIQQVQLVQVQQQKVEEAKQAPIIQRAAQPDLRPEGTANAYIPPAPHVHYGWPEPPLPPGVQFFKLYAKIVNIINEYVSGVVANAQQHQPVAYLQQHVPQQQQQIPQQQYYEEAKVAPEQPQIQQAQSSSYIPPPPHIHYGWPEPPLPPGVIAKPYQSYQVQSQPEVQAQPVQVAIQEAPQQAAYIPPPPHIHYGWPAPPLPPGVQASCYVQPQAPAPAQQIQQQVEVQQVAPQASYIPPPPHVQYGWPAPPLPPGANSQAQVLPAQNNNQAENSRNPWDLKTLHLGYNFQARHSSS